MTRQSRCGDVAVWLVLLSLVPRLAAQEPPTQSLSEANRSARFQSVAPAPEDIHKWIEELSHDTFAVREAAASQLLAAGTPARDALQSIVNGPDPEARAAARRLVVLIDRTEFARRLEAFAADTDGRRRLTLPGWEQFRSLVGADEAARALFVDMQRAEGAMLSAAFDVASRPPHQLWEERLMRLVSWQVTAGNRNAPAPLASCAAMIFLGSVTEIDVSDNGALLVDNLIQRSPVRETVASQGPRDALRRLVVAWILHCPNKNEEILKRRLNLMTTLLLKEAVQLAIQVANRQQQHADVQPMTRAYALLVAGQLGNDKLVESLEPLLTDATICMPLQAPQPGQSASNVQIRDVALVVMLHLTGQRPADYGYHHARLQPQQLFVLESLHCESDERRAHAAAKWRDWRKSSSKRQERRVERQEPGDSRD
jgi:hypothetical protein